MGSRPRVEPSRRRGRPAESDGLTSERILAAARECFAESGYAAASTHMVAARVGLTTGALYHHFASKRVLYLAVFDEVERTVVERLSKAAAPATRFADKLDAVIDEMVRISREEPTLIGFLQTVLADMGRHPDVRRALAPALELRDQLLAGLVDAGVAGGEFDEADRHLVLDTVTGALVGLIAINLGSPSLLEHAAEGYKRLFRGELVRTKAKRR